METWVPVILLFSSLSFGASLSTGTDRVLDSKPKQTFQKSQGTDGFNQMPKTHVETPKYFDPFPRILIPSSPSEHFEDYMNDEDIFVDRKREKFRNHFHYLNKMIPPPVFYFKGHDFNNQGHTENYHTAQGVDQIAFLDISDLQAITSILSGHFDHQGSEHFANDKSQLKTFFMMPLNKEDVKKFIISVPSRCPPGQEMDYSGSCREIFPKMFGQFNHIRKTTFESSKEENTPTEAPMENQGENNWQELPTEPNEISVDSVSQPPDISRDVTTSANGKP